MVVFQPVILGLKEIYVERSQLSALRHMRDWDAWPMNYSSATSAMMRNASYLT